MPHNESSTNDSTKDFPTLAPIGGPAAPIPELISRGANAATAQPWATARDAYPMVVVAGRATNRDVVSEFRKGEIILEPTGVTLQGKAILPTSIRWPIILVSLLLGAGWLVAYIIVEYAIRVDRKEMLTWENIGAVVLDSEKQRAGISYHLPGKPKRSYGLGLKLEGGLFTEFARSVRQYAPERVTEGKILSPTPVWVWWVVGAILAFVIVTIIITVWN